MLDFAQHADRPCLRLLVLHDDAEREFDYTSGAEQALERAAQEEWTVVSMRQRLGEGMGMSQRYGETVKWEPARRGSACCACWSRWRS